MSNNYWKLLGMFAVSFVWMFISTYFNVNAVNNIYLNLNRTYMAGVMAMPMIIWGLLIMRHMYQNKTLNTIFLTASVLFTLLFFFGIRAQGGVEDKQFLQSMIPHHSSAILMCERAQITDQEIKDLCDQIVKSQQEEIDQMKKISERIVR